ncbi:hypothetical protein SAY87_017665 [Trapa incisa]|uniref:Uncharacterized protein n=1 Tax=Trapa incisa TaxID=236973 RepID=A0AAN7KW66_9MYRT|nr:hypothetical protein SAY87_017665 [Trapa incisa]
MADQLTDDQISEAFSAYPTRTAMVIESSHNSRSISLLLRCCSIRGSAVRLPPAMSYVRGLLF